MWSITTFAFSQAEIYIDMNGAEMEFQALLSKFQVISSIYLSNNDLSWRLMLISESVTIMSFRGWWFYGIMSDNRDLSRVVSWTFELHRQASPSSRNLYESLSCNLEESRDGPRIPRRRRHQPSGGGRGRCQQHTLLPKIPKKCMKLRKKFEL